MIRLNNPGASVLVPDDLSWERAVARISHMGIGAHPDDLEILALHGILACRGTRGFCGVVCAHGGESVREIRRREQEEAARIGRYGLLVQLDYASGAVKDPEVRHLESDLTRLFEQVHPAVLYTHNPADRHDTHVAVSLAVLRVLRRLTPAQRPRIVYGCEVWGSLDWLPDRVALNVGEGGSLGTDLLRVFRSQIEGGKHYDEAAAGRRRANATFADPYTPDADREVCFAMDLTPLISNPSLSISDWISAKMEAFAKSIMERIRQFDRT